MCTVGQEAFGCETGRRRQSYHQLKGGGRQKTGVQAFRSLGGDVGRRSVNV